MNKSAHRNAVAWFEIHVADMQRDREPNTESNTIGLHSIKQVTRMDS